MTEFYISYCGNKRREINYIEPFLKLDNIKTFVEPFGGSCFLSNYIYQKYPHIKIEISDIDKDLTYFCNNFYKNRDEILNKVNDIINKINNKEDYYNYINNPPNEYNEDKLIYYLIYNKYYCIRKGMYPTIRGKPKFKYIDKTKIYDEFFKNNYYNNFDYKILMEKYKDDKNGFFYLDPPYIQADCTTYFNSNIDWEYIINFVKSCKCKFILHVNYNVFMKYLFEPYCKKHIHYDFTYSNRASKIRDYKTIHSIYSNID